MSIWSSLFRSEKARVKPVLLEDVNTAAPPNPEIESQRSLLGLTLMRDVALSAAIAGQLRQTVTTQVAAKIQGRL